MQKTEQIYTDFQKKEDRSSEKDINRLKNAWERLQKFQEKTLSRFRKRHPDGQISSVKIITDNNGRKTVQINLLNGKKIMDSGDCRAVFQKMIPKKQINIGKLISLLQAVRLYGFAAVAASLPHAMKVLLFKACKKCGVPLRAKQKQTLSRTAEPAKLKVGGILPKISKPVKDPTATSSSLILSFFDLQESIRQQKKENNNRLQRILQNDREKAKEKYFNRLRLILTEIEQSQKNGNPLTEEQEKIKKLTDRLGLHANKENEKLTDLQKERQRSFSLQDLPKDIQNELKNEIKRHKAICSSKNKAADLIFDRHARNVGKEGTIRFSSDTLAREINDFLPPPNQRNITNMEKTLKKIERQAFAQKEESKKTKKEKKDRIAKLMAETMTASANHKRPNLQQELTMHTVQRKSFLSNAVIIREFKNKRLTER